MVSQYGVSPLDPSEMFGGPPPSPVEVQSVPQEPDFEEDLYDPEDSRFEGMTPSGISDYIDALGLVKQFFEKFTRLEEESISAEGPGAERAREAANEAYEQYEQAGDRAQKIRVLPVNQLNTLDEREKFTEEVRQFDTGEERAGAEFGVTSGETAQHNRATEADAIAGTAETERANRTREGQAATGQQSDDYWATVNTAKNPEAFRFNQYLGGPGGGGGGTQTPSTRPAEDISLEPGQVWTNQGIKTREQLAQELGLSEVPSDAELFKMYANKFQTSVAVDDGK